MTKGNKTSSEAGMGMSLPLAEFISYWANWVLIGALVVGVIATYGIVVAGNIKEAALRGEIAKTTENAAIANASAAQARLETARLWKEASFRKISHDVFLKALEGKPKAEVQIFFAKNDSDSSEMAQQLFFLLLEAKWTVTGNPLPIPPSDKYPVPDALMLHAQPSGVSIIINADVGPGMTGDTAFDALGRALFSQLGSIGRAVDKTIQPGLIRLVVAPKPPLRDPQPGVRPE